MAYEQRPNSGSIFANDKKTKDTHPDGAGNALIECPHCKKVGAYFVDSWTKKPEGKQPYRSLKFKAKDKQPTGGTTTTNDDDIP